MTNETFSVKLLNGMEGRRVIVYTSSGNVIGEKRMV